MTVGSGSTGSVALVGGGPGDPGLITVRGMELLQQADVVVVDRLAPRVLLERLRPGVEVIDGGKRPGCHTLTQREIEAVLLDRAQRGLRVVRLKGGDPFVFGRGAEELLACTRAGIPCEVVPGVSSAFAVPASAGIPVTARGVADAVRVLSGHGTTGPGGTIDWRGAAAGSDTLVLLMALGGLERISAELVAGGRDPATPAAVIASGTTEHQQVLITDLASAARRVAEEGIESPAVVVIGDVVGLRSQWQS
ncbi:MAG: uroporphyrinogen-III C-methyltransferase [Actinomycetota bacterium]|nr:uroporphyrinogen-III C-methyltransferase [Actinomycetota bacterium]